jgi:hypothetical protein
LFCPLWAEKLLPNKKRQDPSAEQLGQSGVVQVGDPMEGPALIHSALGHQEMEARVKVNPIRKGLDRGDDARRDIFLCHSPEVNGQGVDGTATEVAEEIGIFLSLILLLFQNLQ